jgi:hypothetical protein
MRLFILIRKRGEKGALYQDEREASGRFGFRLSLVRKSLLHKVVTAEFQQSLSIVLLLNLEKLKLALNFHNQSHQV